MISGAGVGRGNNQASHGNARTGHNHHRWNDAKIVSSQGYAKIRVGPEHSLADPNGYAYEHLLVWVADGRPRPGQGDILHHKNEDKTDNRIANLELMTRPAHAAKHHKMLSDERVRELRERYAAGEDGPKLAAEFCIPFQRAYMMIRGETRRGAGGPIQTGSLRGNNAARRRINGRGPE